MRILEAIKSIAHKVHSKLIIRSLLCICDQIIKYYIKPFFSNTKYMFLLFLGFLNVYSFLLLWNSNILYTYFVLQFKMSSFFVLLLYYLIRNVLVY